MHAHRVREIGRPRNLREADSRTQGPENLIEGRARSGRFMFGSSASSDDEHTNIHETRAIMQLHGSKGHRTPLHYWDTSHFKVVVSVVLLMCDVLGDDLVRHIPSATAEISSRPHMLPPVVLLDVREFQHDLVGRLSLQPLHQTANRDLRGDRYQQMHMILRHVPLHDLHIMRTADLPDQVSHSVGSVSNLLPVLRRPNQVQMDLKDGVRAASILSHLPRLVRGAPS
jgi:hypothetical protein